MDIITLTWVNTLVLLAAIIVGLYQVRKIAEALARVEETAARIQETASRNERLTLAVLERLAPQQGHQA
jgi:predicted transcriptional regulator